MKTTVKVLVFTLLTVGLVLACTSPLAAARPGVIQFNVADGSRSLVPEGISGFEITVSADGMTPITVTLASGQLTATIEVPAGPNRLVSVKAKNSANQFQYKGSASLDVVAGVTHPLDVRLAEAFAVSYFANAVGTSGSVPVEPDLFLPNEAVTVRGNTGNLTRPGYSLAAWNTLADGSGTSRTSGQTLPMVVGGLELHAVWQPVNYTITYVLNGGTNHVSNPATYTIESPLISLENPTGPYIFVGWFSDASFTTQVFGIAAGSTGNRTLYAKWDIPTYNLVFDPNGAGVSGTMADFPMQQGSVSNIPANTFSRSAYTFQGWNTQADGSGTAYGNGVSITMGATDILLYAQWQPVVYTVSYVLNGGTNHGSNPASFTIESPNLMLYDPTNGVIVFEGWYSFPDFSGAVVTDIPTGSTGNRTLYAKWQIPMINIIFQQNGGLGSMPDQVVPENTMIALQSNTFTRTGYAFIGWNTMSDGSGTLYGNMADITVGTTDITLYAQWDAEIYTVTFDAQGGSAPVPASKGVTYDSSYGPLATTSRAGYTFGGWWTGAGGTGMEILEVTTVVTAGSHPLFAKWNPIVYQIGYYPNGGSGTDFTNNHNYNDMINLEPNTFTRPGHDFAGWGENPGGPVVYADNQPVTVVNHLTLYAQWTPQQYTVTFDAVGGSAPVPASKLVTYNSTYGALASTTSPGYNFLGWYTAPSGMGDLVETITPVTITANQTLFAHWEPLEFQITFQPNGGVGSAYTQNKFTDETSPLASNTFTRPGFVFVGWSTAVNPAVGSAADYTDMANFTMPPSNVTLYAVWHYAAYAMGDIGPSGGWIFYDKGFMSDGWRYMEAASNTVGEWANIPWAPANGAHNTPETDIGFGITHTEDLRLFGPGYAAWLCWDLSVDYGGNTYNDWFLPSRDELAAMRSALYPTPGNLVGEYWSTSEQDEFNAYLIVMSTGIPTQHGKTATASVRAVRRF